MRTMVRGRALPFTVLGLVMVLVVGALALSGQGGGRLGLVGTAATDSGLIGHWTFETGSTHKDLTGRFGDLQLLNGANVANGHSPWAQDQ